MYKKTEMGKECSTYGGERRSYRILVGTPEGRGYLEDTGVDGSMILKWILKNWDGGMDWIDLTQDRDW
jgi:hypothetical protein